jgi:hypothetical protein
MADATTNCDDMMCHPLSDNRDHKESGRKNRPVERCVFFVPGEAFGIPDGSCMAEYVSLCV